MNSYGITELIRAIYILQEDSYCLILNELILNADKKRTIKVPSIKNDEFKTTGMIEIPGGLKKSANKSTDIIKRGY